MLSGLITIESRFSTPVAKVFQAWSRADHLKQWAWGSLANDVEATVDFRIGGRYCIATVRPEGEVWSFSGIYSEIIPNQKIVFTLNWDAPMGYESDSEVVTVEFVPIEDGTKVIFTHEGVPTAEAREGHLKGWQNTFEFLDKLLIEAGE